MSKHKKIFKQKIKEMLSQIERMPTTPVALPPPPQPSTPVPKESVAPPKSVTPASTAKIPQPAPSTSSLVPVSIVKSDLKKIALLFSAMILVVILTAFISSKTNWLLDLASRLYDWAKLGT